MSEDTAKQSLNQRTLLGTALALIVFTTLIGFLFYKSYTRLEEFNKPFKVFWNNEGDVELNATPVWFMYDSDTLYSTKPIKTEDKLLLLNLISSSSFNQSYKKAIEKLTFLSNDDSRISFTLFLLIGGLSAVIGVQIRTLYDFVGNACYTFNFNLKVWWPWYVIRPFLGFLLGGFVVVLLEAKLFNSTVYFPDRSNLYLIGFTILAGFGVTDVVGVIRSLSKKIFSAEAHSEAKPSNKKEK